MKKLLILVAALFLITGFAMAQQADSSQHHSFTGRGFGGKRMAMNHRRAFNMASKLQLTDAQKQQMKTVNDDYHKQLTALQANDKLSLGDYKTQLAALRKSRKDQVSNILTDDQKKMVADRKQNMQINMQARSAGNLERMKLKLGLSDDQVAKIKTQREQLHSQVKELRENTSLLPEQKRDQMKTLFAQQKDELKSVLTPEQLSKLESMKKQHMHYRSHSDAK